MCLAPDNKKRLYQIYASCLSQKTDIIHTRIFVKKYIFTKYNKFAIIGQIVLIIIIIISDVRVVCNCKLAYSYLYLRLAFLLRLAQARPGSEADFVG